MISFWITFAVVGLFGVPCVLMFATCGTDTKNKIGGSLACIIFWFLVAGVLHWQEVGNAERWNNGLCECGQHWELSAVAKSRSGTETKYYTCSNCYNEIEIIH